MPLEEIDLKYLWDMFDAGRSVVEYTTGVSRENYLADDMRRHAVERVVEIIGEAGRRVSEAARRQFPTVEWGAIVATRHILAHDYDDVDHEKIWRIATVHVPELMLVLGPALQANPPGPESAKDPGEP